MPVSTLKMNEYVLAPSHLFAHVASDATIALHSTLRARVVDFDVDLRTAALIAADLAVSGGSAVEAVSWEALEALGEIAEYPLPRTAKAAAAPAAPTVGIGSAAFMSAERFRLNCPRIPAVVRVRIDAIVGAGDFLLVTLTEPGFSSRQYEVAAAEVTPAMHVASLMAPPAPQPVVAVAEMGVEHVTYELELIRETLAAGGDAGALAVAFEGIADIATGAAAACRAIQKLTTKVAGV